MNSSALCAVNLNFICGKRKEVRYWQITTDPEELPSNTTWYVMSKYPDITPREVGNFYGLRTWVEYGLKQSRGMRPAACELECIQARSAGKNELGWADFRVTSYPQIQRWWEIICSAYLLVSLHGEQLLKLPPQSESKFSSHPWWNNKSGWNNILNNLRLIIQPFVFFNLIKPWLKVFKTPELYQGFLKLQRIINYFTNSIFSQLDYWDFCFSSA